MVAYSFAHVGDLGVSATPRVRRLLKTSNTTFGYISYDIDDNPLGPGLECGVIDPIRGLRMTTDWFETVSASGNAVITCIFTNGG
jgi:hypothetical protein